MDITPGSVDPRKKGVVTKVLGPSSVTGVTKYEVTLSSGEIIEAERGRLRLEGITYEPPSKRPRNSGGSGG
eukprot:633-Heterococcus_DN1.PRE.1